MYCSTHLVFWNRNSSSEQKQESHPSSTTSQGLEGRCSEVLPPPWQARRTHHPSCSIITGTWCRWMSLSLYFSDCTMYLSQIAKYIYLNWQNAFVSNCYIYLSQFAKVYLSQIAKHICLKLQNVFVSIGKIYLSHFAKCICLKLLNRFVSICTMYLSHATPQLPDHHRQLLLMLDVVVFLFLWQSANFLLCSVLASFPCRIFGTEHWTTRYQLRSSFNVK